MLLSNLLAVCERIESNVLSSIIKAKPLFVSAAQEEYDSWEQDDSGISDEFGSGGICDRISIRVGEILSDLGFDVHEAGQDGDDHAWVVAVKDGEAYGVDIPPWVYESGGGYTWRKKEGVFFKEEEDIHVWKEDISNYGEREWE